MCTGRLFYRPLSIATVAELSGIYMPYMRQSCCYFLNYTRNTLCIVVFVVMIYIFKMFSNGIPPFFNYISSTLRAQSV